MKKVTCAARTRAWAQRVWLGFCCPVCCSSCEPQRWGGGTWETPGHRQNPLGPDRTIGPESLGHAGQPKAPVHSITQSSYPVTLPIFFFFFCLFFFISNWLAIIVHIYRYRVIAPSINTVCRDRSRMVSTCNSLSLIISVLGFF